MSDKVEEQYHLGEHEETLDLFRLRNAQNCCGYLLPHLRSLKPSFRLLDLGCGPGSITFDLANLFPEAIIIGVDLSKEVTAQNNAKIPYYSKHSNIEFRAGDMLEPLSFLDVSELGSFDVVHEHATLIHMPDAPEALRQMRSICKSHNGVVASRNGDMTSQILHPPCPENMKLILKSYEASHGDASVGRKLVDHAMQAGWDREQIVSTASIMTNRTSEERQAYAKSMLANLGDENSEMRKKAALLGFGPNDIGKMQENMLRFADSPYGSRLLVCCEILCFNNGG
ncbi:S-adenosyl-L-methionine-dependent methyltransferase [Pyrenochaeta sp. DS3sAY3a]|nr:S-adenosyl-L-methionine-dependent methyltransferase [Pyrenochaeta sp. DS3sAY3a]